MKNYFLFSLIVLFFFASCASIGSSKKQPSLLNTHWTLADQVKGKTPTLKIEQGKVFGNAGCNNYFGELVLDTTTGGFTTDKMGSTRMACDNMSVEDNFLKMIGMVNKYKINGNTLELYKDNLLLLKFNKD